MPVEMTYTDGYQRLYHAHTQRNGGDMLRGLGIVLDLAVLTLGHGQ